MYLMSQAKGYLIKLHGAIINFCVKNSDFRYYKRTSIRVWELLARFARASSTIIFLAANRSLSYGCNNKRLWSRKIVAAKQFGPASTWIKNNALICFFLQFFFFVHRSKTKMSMEQFVWCHRWLLLSVLGFRFLITHRFEIRIFYSIWNMRILNI